MDRLALLGGVDLAHAALANPLQQRVRTDLRPRSQRRPGLERAQNVLARQPREQASQLVAQGAARAALALDERRMLGRLQIGRAFE